MHRVLFGLAVLVVLMGAALAQGRSPLKPPPQAFAADVFRLVSDLQAANAPAATLANAQSLYDHSRASGLAGMLSPLTQSYVRALSAHDAGEAASLLAKMNPFEQGLAAYLRHDYGLAQKLWLPVANAGDAEAAANLGMLYAGGNNGASQDDQEAFRWYRRAAALGQEVAQEDLAVLYLEGRGAATDPVRAFLWRTVAAAQLVKAGYAATASTLVKQRDTAAPEPAAVTRALDMAARCSASQYKDCD